ncbi:MAG TPA: GFA family protein [Pseudomonadales bacterium]|nr:GFA family protein [Pseudomonadales bacterium]
MTRIAQCHCGQVRLTCEGEPDPVLMCSCELCQRRTGSPIHIGAWFRIEDVRLEGETKAFTRTSGDMGREATFNFCPVCGTSVWWGGRSEGFLAGRIGIAGGCFADADFPPPTHAFYDKRRHPWVAVPAGIPCYLEGPPPEDMATFMS